VTRGVASGGLADGSTRMWDRMSVSALPFFFHFWTATSPNWLPKLTLFLVCLHIKHTTLLLQESIQIQIQIQILIKISQVIFFTKGESNIVARARKIAKM